MVLNNIKADNILDIPITVGGQSAVSKCKLPSKFSEEVITLECSASGLSELRNLAGEEIEFGEVTDRINILYTSIKADNLVKANKLFPGENVISTTSGTNEPGSPFTTSNRPYKKIFIWLISRNYRCYSYTLFCCFGSWYYRFSLYEKKYSF